MPVAGKPGCEQGGPGLGCSQFGRRANTPFAHSATSKSVGQPDAAAFIPLGSPRWFWRRFAVSVRPVARALNLIIATAIAALVIGCGDGDDGEDLLTKDSLRECLAEAELASSPTGGDRDPDFGV